MNTKIPPYAYVDPEIFRAEQVELFRRQWVFMGLGRDLIAPNDFVTRDIGGVSISVRNCGGTLRAFHNVCSHRFNRIHTSAKGNGPFQCGYHGWLYDENGTPAVIPKRPRFDGLTFEKLCELRLVQWKVERCGDLVFVCGDPEAPQLRSYLGEAFNQIEAISNACGTIIDENIINIGANWKILIENTLESYHVGFIHPATFARLGTTDGEFRTQGVHSSWNTSLGKQFAARIEHLLPLFSSRPVRVNGYHHQLIFPNLTLASTYGTSFSLQLFEPITAAQTKFTSIVFQTKLEMPSTTAVEALAALCDSARQFNRAVFSEDKEVCENVQKGTSETTKNGILSDEELRVSMFQSSYLNLMRQIQ